jgi:predicted DNA-binding ArsR family transcriptional regulator
MAIVKILVHKLKEDVNFNISFHLMINKIIREINKDNINFFEIGTAYGDSSTRVIYKELNKAGKKFQLTGFEPIDEIHKTAVNRWKDFNNVKILKNYFLSTDSVKFLVEVIKKEITDGQTLKNNIYNYLTIPSEFLVERTLLSSPSIIFIDSIRYSHVGIVNTIMELELNDAVIIMEDDIPNYGELRIIEKYFKLSNLKKFRCYPHQWPYISFMLDKRIKGEGKG